MLRALGSWQLLPAIPERSRFSETSFLFVSITGLVESAHGT